MKTTEMTFEELRAQREALNEEWENRRIAAWDNILKAFEEYTKQFGSIRWVWDELQNLDEISDESYDSIRSMLKRTGYVQLNPHLDKEIE